MNTNTQHQDQAKPAEFKTISTILKKTVALIVIIFTLLMLAAPPFIVHLVTNGHIDYEGTSENHPLQDIYQSQDFGLQSKEIYLTTDDGFNVWVSEVSVANPKGVIIYLSGIQQPSVTYFYGHSKWMKDYATILLEVRGHGKSDGDKVCLGYNEVADVRAVVQYIKEQEKYKRVPIIIHGVSMGGTIAINAFGSIREIDGLIAMSAYSSFEDVVYDTMRNYSIPKFICNIEKFLVRKSLQFVFGDKVDVVKPIEQIKRTGNRPVLLIAATEDTEVPPINMQRILANAPAGVESWLKDSWEHFIVNDCDFKNMEQDKEYCERILAFIESIVITR